MKINQNKINEVEKIFRRADSVIDSVNFWDKKIDEVLFELDFLNEKNNLTLEEKERKNFLTDELLKLFKRIEIESNYIDEIEKNISDYIKKQNKKTN